MPMYLKIWPQISSMSITGDLADSQLTVPSPGGSGTQGVGLAIFQQAAQMIQMHALLCGA